VSLLNPTVGDLCDRLSILALKRLHGSAAGKDVSHFQREWAGLLAKIHGRQLNGAWFEHVLDLAAVNAKLWTLTDEMRDYVITQRVAAQLLPEAGQVAKCGMSIMLANDRRAELIQTINELTGDTTTTEKEKL
jgi:hypothetical protein